MSQGTSGGTSGGKQNSDSGTVFPSGFLRNFSDVYGPGFNVSELVRSMPRTSGLFGGNYGLFPSSGAAPAAGAPGGGPATAGGAPGAAGGGVAPSGLDVGQIESFGRVSNEREAISHLLERSGAKAGDRLTLDQLRESASHLSSDDQKNLLPILSSAEAQLALAPGADRFQAGNAAPGALAGTGGLNAGAERLGFGQAPIQATEQQIRTLPTIEGARVNFAPEGFNRYEDALRERAFQPVRRELERTQDINERNLNSDLAARGLASSGTGLGQIAKGRRESAERIKAAATDATNAAIAQRTQAELQVRMQEAGFDQQASIENAANVLRGDMAKSENYLKTLGFNVESASKAKADFLALAGLQEQDLQRLDTFQLGVADRLLNNWLQTLSATGNIGQYSAGKSKQSARQGQAI